MSTPTNKQRLQFLSVPVDNITYSETIEWCSRAITSKKLNQICTVNPEFVMLAQSNSCFMSVLNNSSLCLPDGQGLLWAALLKGLRLRERVAGSTLVDLIAKEACAKQWNLFFLGAGPGVAETAAKKLSSKYPNLPKIRCLEGSPLAEDFPKILSCIQKHKPDFLLVAFGAPNQELWINRYIKDLNVPVSIGVGGAFDFISGNTKRAPLLIQRLGFEWLHRLWIQPWRWKRMLALPLFMWKIITNNTSVTYTSTDK